MSRVIQNLSLAVPQKHGADWANNTAEAGAPARTRKEKMAMHKALDEWIHGRTYNKGEMASVDGKFYAINNHVHFRFLNTDKQSELAIREVRRDVYEALSTRFGVTKNSDTLLALQEFLFGSTTVREPLTCDEVYSLLRLINKTRDGSGNERFQEDDYDPKEHALQKATYGQLVKFMETARKVKHTNMTTAELDALSVYVGGLTFTAADFIKGYGKHDSVRKTTVKVNCYNDLLETEKEVRNGLMEDVRGHLNRLGDAVQKLEDLRKDVENLKAKIQAPIAAQELRAAIDAVKTNLEGSEEMKLKRGGLIFELNSLRSNLDKGLELDPTVPDSLLSQVSNAYEEAHGSLVSIQKASEEGRCLPLVGLKSAGLDKQMDYLLSRAELFYKTGSKNKGIGEGLEFYKSLAADGREMPAIDKLLHLEDRLWRLLAEHVDGMPEVRRQPVLRELLIELGKRSVREALNTLAEVQVKTTDEYSPWTRKTNKIVDVSSLIQEKANAFTYLIALFSPEVMDRLVRNDLEDLLDGESADSAPLLERLGMLDRLLRTKGDTMTGLTGRLNSLNNHLTGQYGESFPKPERSDDLDKMLVKIKEHSLAAKRRSVDFANYLHDNGFSQEEIDRAFANGKLHGAAVLLADGDFRAEALKVVSRKCPDLASRLRELERRDEDGRLLDTLGAAVPEVVKKDIKEVLGCDDVEFETVMRNALLNRADVLDSAQQVRKTVLATLKGLSLDDCVDKAFLEKINRYAMFVNDANLVIGRLIKATYDNAEQIAIGAADQAIAKASGKIADARNGGNVVDEIAAWVDKLNARRAKANVKIDAETVRRRIKSAACKLALEVSEIKREIQCCGDFIAKCNLNDDQRLDENGNIVWDVEGSGSVFATLHDYLKGKFVNNNTERRLQLMVEVAQKAKNTLEDRLKRKEWMLDIFEVDVGLKVTVGVQDKARVASAYREPEPQRNVQDEITQEKANQDAVLAKLATDLKEAYTSLDATWIKGDGEIK